VILDVGLPDASGFEVFKRIRAASEVPVVFLTARSDEIDRVVGLELGADDYVAKPFSPRELVARVRGVLRRTARAAGDTSGTPSRRSFQERRRPPRRGRSPSTKAHADPLLRSPARALALRVRPAEDARRTAGHVFTRDALLERVWGNDTESMDRTVDAHVKTLRAKMKAVVADVEPIRTLRGSGYASRKTCLPPRDSVTRRTHVDIRPPAPRRCRRSRRRRDARRSGGVLAADPPPRTYAVVSLLGDQISVIKRRPQVGTRVDPNDRLEIPSPTRASIAWS
jgi:two-component system catabolic regulation response regulator CreB